MQHKDNIIIVLDTAFSFELNLFTRIFLGF